MGRVDERNPVQRGRTMRKVFRVVLHLAGLYFLVQGVGLFIWLRMFRGFVEEGGDDRFPFPDFVEPVIRVMGGLCVVHGLTLLLGAGWFIGLADRPSPGDRRWDEL
jgi:hypothetical protein